MAFSERGGKQTITLPTLRAKALKRTAQELKEYAARVGPGSETHSTDGKRTM
jgi:hypothetical protein